MGNGTIEPANESVESSAFKKTSGLLFGDLLHREVFEVQAVIRWWNVLFAMLATGDWNPIHWNPSFAKKQGLVGVIAHGILITGVVSKVFGSGIFAPGVKVLETNIKFKRPVYPGDKISLTMEIKEIRPGILPRVWFDIKIWNPDNKIVCDGSVLVAVPK